MSSSNLFTNLIVNRSRATEGVWATVERIGDKLQLHYEGEEPPIDGEGRPVPAVLLAHHKSTTARFLKVHEESLREFQAKGGNEKKEEGGALLSLAECTIRAEISFLNHQGLIEQLFDTELPILVKEKSKVRIDFKMMKKEDGYAADRKAGRARLLFACPELLDAVTSFCSDATYFSCDTEGESGNSASSDGGSSKTSSKKTRPSSMD